LRGYEFKWSSGRNAKKQAFDWLDSYNLITKKNLQSLVFKH